MGYEPTRNMFTSLRRKDNERKRHAGRKVSVSRRRIRQTQRLHRKLIKTENIDYLSGGFSLSVATDRLLQPVGINFFKIFFYTNHPLQGFRSHCSVRGYSSLLVATAEAEATTRTGRQHTHTRARAHTHTHTQPPTQPFITSKHDMKSLLVREQVCG